ncbi:MAG: hypothetical protein DRN00_04115 [Thermoplasmata archaeon]|nr:MAG: hypothetical protein DRN00_04115 [Thermoplasmata archaeon]
MKLKWLVAFTVAAILDIIDWLIAGMVPVAGDVVDVIGVVVLMLLTGSLWPVVGLVELVPVVGDVLPTFLAVTYFAYKAEEGKAKGAGE